jgi:dolichyl-phosphate beta-glucosyltransferase
MGMKTLSIIIPAYNEEIHIASTLDEIVREDKNHSFSILEIVVVDDGSTDETKNIVNEYSLKDERVRCEGYQNNIGKGGAVLHGIKKTTGDYKIFLDADGSTHIESVSNLLNDMFKNDYDILVGSRAKWAGGEIIAHQSKKRSQLGNIGVVLVKRLLDMPIKDTQCGCKIFKKEVAEDIFSNLRIKGWMFDCEVLYKAHNKGYKVKEKGVKWSHENNSKVKLTSYIRSFVDLVIIKLYEK